MINVHGFYMFIIAIALVVLFVWQYTMLRIDHANAKNLQTEKEKKKNYISELISKISN